MLDFHTRRTTHLGFFSPRRRVRPTVTARQDGSYIVLSSKSNGTKKIRASSVYYHVRRATGLDWQTAFPGESYWTSP